MPNKTFIIAEIGLSHEGSVGIAKSFIDETVKAGADAVKFQMHMPNYESSKFEQFRKKNIFIQDRNRFDYWKRTSFTEQQWKFLREYCKKKKINFFCSPFSLEAVRLLKKIKIDVWKIASGEFNNMMMLDEIIKSNKKKIILSNGLSYEKEIKEIIFYLKKKKQSIALLECNTAYPTKIENAGHNLMRYFRDKYKIETGLSDHTGNINSLIAAISYEANYIEAHITFNKNFFGADTSSSIDFDELKFVCKYRDDLFKLKYSKKKKINLDKNQIKMRKIFTKSIFTNKLINKNQKIKLSDIIDKKPLIGISAKDYKKILGKKVKKKIYQHQPLQISFIKK